MPASTTCRWSPSPRGLGRAPGSDQRVARALRRTLASDERQFPQDVLELQAFLAGDEQLGITAVPGAGTHIPLWLLGSSTFGAQLAAMLGQIGRASGRERVCQYV